MNERLFAGQEAREWGSSEREDYLVMIGYAQELGLDVTGLRACVEDNRSARLIEADYNNAMAQGFSSTPSFLINGQPFIGAQPYDAWKRAIDQMLGE